jgi:hypothetical protein
MAGGIEAIVKWLDVGRKRDGRSIYSPQARCDLRRSTSPKRTVARTCASCCASAASTSRTLHFSVRPAFDIEDRRRDEDHDLGAARRAQRVTSVHPRPRGIRNMPRIRLLRAPT